MTLLIAGALTDPQLAATASSVCTTDARLATPMVYMQWDMHVFNWIEYNSMCVVHSVKWFVASIHIMMVCWFASISFSIIIWSVSNMSDVLLSLPKPPFVFFFIIIVRTCLSFCLHFWEVALYFVIYECCCPINVRFPVVVTFIFAASMVERNTILGCVSRRVVSVTIS